MYRRIHVLKWLVKNPRTYSEGLTMVSNIRNTNCLCDETVWGMVSMDACIVLRYDIFEGGALQRNIARILNVALCHYWDQYVGTVYLG